MDLLDLVDVGERLHEFLREYLPSAVGAGAVYHLENGVFAKNIQIVRKTMCAVHKIVAAVKIGIVVLQGF